MKLKLEQTSRENLIQMKFYNIVCNQVFITERITICRKVEISASEKVWEQVCDKIRLSLKQYKIFKWDIK